MAARQSGLIQRTMEKVVSKPPLATLVVGSSILILFQIINELTAFWPQCAYLRYIVPFIPPFFITRTAKRINQRIAEYSFIKDAEPYIFVSFPKDASIKSLLNARADMISDSASRHFNYPYEELLKLEALPTRFFANSEDREMMVSQLIEDFQKTKKCGAIRDYQVSIKPHGKDKTDLFLVNSVLKENEGRLKWQATMMKYKSDQASDIMDTESRPIK